ncbi:MAG: M81 family metallopeptidase [Alphaproteobacteria bacterium]
MRIIVGGFQHETNTFAPTLADFAAFNLGGGWPPLTRGDAIFEVFPPMNIPLGGAMKVFRDAGCDVVPTVWASATPSSFVTEDAFERIAAMILEDIEVALPADGVYLDLHGAMVTEHFEDGEGELLRRVRNLVGPEMPVSVSLDLHANVTPDMVEHATVIDIFRCYPHTDMAETGERAANHLLAILREGKSWHAAFRQVPFLIPLQWGCTFHDPCKRLYEKDLETLAGGEGVRALSFAPGFPLSDIHHCGPSVLAYGDTQDAADNAADAMLQAIEDATPEFAGMVYGPEEAVAYGKEMGVPNLPLVIADMQDNPGGGGPGDTTGMLRALLDADAKGAVIGVFNDPETAMAAHAAGQGGIVQISLGGKLFPGDEPLEVNASVVRLGDGVFTGTGPMWGGSPFTMGRMACLDVRGVKIVVASAPEQAGDKEMFRHVGIEPKTAPVLVLKSSVHFRADFQPIAREVIIAAAPGPVYADIGGLTFNNLRPTVRQAP